MINDIYSIYDKETSDDYYNNIERGVEIVSDVSANRYVIINQIWKNAYSSTFSAIKVDVNEYSNTNESQSNYQSKKKIIESVDFEKFMIKFYRKDLIEEYIIAGLNIRQTAKRNFYEDLKNEFISCKEDEQLKENKEYIQQIHDIHISSHGVFVITEFCEVTLIDYLRKIRDTMKTNKCAELKYKHIFLPIIDLIHNLEYKVTFSGLLNSSDIFVNESMSFSSAGGKSSFLKIMHPFFNQLETIFKILDGENFPNFYPPEFLAQFKQDDQSSKIQLVSSDLSDSLSLINHNFDMWALGYLLYEILFESVPFKFGSLEKAKIAFGKNIIKYKIKRNKYTEFIIDFIVNSMKTDNRLNLRNVKIGIYKEAIADSQNFERLNLKYLINPEKYKENEEKFILISK